MTRLIGAVVLIAVLVAGIAAAWWYRPWSPYSPAAISALDDPGQFVDTFQRMDEILPSRTIEASDPDPLPRAVRALDFTYDWDGAEKTLEDWFEEAHATSFMVVSNGEVIYETYRQGADADTRHTSWSMGKSFVATLIGMALDEGLIESLDDPAETYAPSYAGSDYGATSIRDLLTMSAGMDFQEEYSETEPSDVRPLFFNTFILSREPDAMVAEIAREREPGRDLHYTSPNTQVLAAVARGVFGGSLAEIVEQRIWAPLEMTEDATWLQNKPDEAGQALGYCCLQAVTEDYAKFGELYRNLGRHDGEQLVSADWAEAVGRPLAEWAEPAADGPYPGRGYGLHFWLAEGYQPSFAAAGVYGQWIWIDRPRGVVIVQTAGDPVWTERRAETFHLFDTLARHVAPEPQAASEAEPDVQPDTEPTE